MLSYFQLLLGAFGPGSELFSFTKVETAVNLANFAIPNFILRRIIVIGKEEIPALSLFIVMKFHIVPLTKSLVTANVFVVKGKCT